MKRNLRNKIIFGVVGAIILSFVFTGIISRGWFSVLHLKSSNFLYYTNQNHSSEDIVIVAIDDKSFEVKNASELGTLQFGKKDYATVIENLEQAGAKVIGIDVILSEISSQEDRNTLIDVLKKYDNIVLAAEPKTEVTYGLKPLTEFVEIHPENVGAILFSPDIDNILRRQNLVFKDEVSSDAFSLLVAKKYLDLREGDSQLSEKNYQLMPFSVRVNGKKYSPISVPFDEKKTMLINFFGPPNSFQSISFIDAYNDQFTERKTNEKIDLTGKIVLIGEMGTGLHDEQYVPVSFGQAMPGVEIHANALQTILSQKFVVSQSSSSMMAVVHLTIIMGLLLFLSLSIAFSVLFYITFSFAYIVITWVVFEYGLILNTIYPHLALITTLVVAYIYRYFTEAKAVKRTEHAFSKYVSSNVVKKILENPDELELGGVEKRLTVFFTDIKGFTTISEKLTPGILVQQLNEYLNEMSEIILSHDGTLDKFVGDAIIAFWGAPVPQNDHALRACLSALEYQKKLKKLRVVWVKADKDPFYARIGIHTGDMIVGNVGSQKRFDYTVIGDAVNLGARLEGVNRFFGTDILISEDTYKEAKKGIEAREIDKITVKGKTKPVRIYELLCKKGALSKQKRKIIHLFAKGLTAYRKQQWQEACRFFKEVLTLDPKDGPSLTYIERCKELKQKKLPKNWDGAYVLTTK